jgi:hypothetical protein
MIAWVIGVTVVSIDSFGGKSLTRRATSQPGYQSMSH